MASPTPWTIVKAPKEYLRPLADGDFSILDANGDEIAEQTEFYPTMLGEEDTALVVRAVNNFDSMLEALENLENDDNSIPDHAWKLVTDAIAKANGGAA